MSSPLLDDLYRDVVLDHYQHPRGRCPLDHADVQNEGFNPVCGDEVRIGLRVENGKILGVEVNGRGCSISVASGSMLAELLPEKSLAEVKELSETFRRMMHGEIEPDEDLLGDLVALEGVQKFPVRIKCALLPWTTLADAVAAYEKGAAAARSTTEEPQLGQRPSLTPAELDLDAERRRVK